jgi:hypothetical protein
MRQCRICRSEYAKQHPAKRPSLEKAMEYRKRWYAKNPFYDRLRLYGMSFEQFQKRLQEQDGKCALCGCVLEKPFIDHDHACCPSTAKGKFKGSPCGKCIRGLLCLACNMALGYLRDNPVLCEKAAAYLRKWGK